jgi:hypothetical protein
LCSSNTPPQTQSAPGRSRRSPSPEKPLLGTRRAHSHPASFFSAKAHRTDRAREGRFAHRNPGHLLQVLPPLGELGERTLLRTEAPPRVSAGACWPSHRVWVFCPEPFTRRERAPLMHRLGVAFDRGEAYYPESAGSLAVVHAPLLHGFDYLPSQIFRIGIHNPMMVRSPSSLQPALVVVCWFKRKGSITPQENSIYGQT